MQQAIELIKKQITGYEIEIQDIHQSKNDLIRKMESDGRKLSEIEANLRKMNFKMKDLKSALEILNRQP